MFKKKKISDFTEVITGGTPSTTVKEYWEGGTIPWLNSGELNKKYIYESKNFITKSGLKSSSTRLMPPDTVLIALTGATTGLSALTKIEACANQSVTGILPSKNHNSDYLLHYLRTQRERILDKAWGNAQPHISQKFVKDLVIPLPSLEEQLHIANVLSKSESLIEQRKMSIVLLDEYLKSFFWEMFGEPVKNEKQWEVKTFEDLVAENCPLTYGIVQPGNEFTNGVPVVRPVDLTQTFISRKGLKLIDPKISEQFKRTVLKGGEILMCVRGTTGVISIASKELAGCNVTRGLVPIWFSNNYNTLFAFQLLQSQGIKNKIQENTYGATLKQINLSDLRKIKLINPPIELQNKFASIVTKIEYLKDQYRNNLQELENLYGSISQSAFKV
jgi:type I restriction enzyme S subunit